MIIEFDLIYVTYPLKWDEHELKKYKVAASPYEFRKFELDIKNSLATDQLSKWENGNRPAAISHTVYVYQLFKRV